MAASTSPFASYRPRTDRLLFALSLIGILLVVHLWLQTDRGFDRGCLGFSEPDPTFNCDAVVQSEAGKLLGVSNIVWGFLFYVLLAWMSAAVPVVGNPWREKIKQARAVLIGFGLVYSTYLVYVQYVVLGEYCLLCLLSALTVVLMALVLVYEWRRRPPGLREGEAERFRKEKRYFAGAAIALVVVLVADVVYFRSLPDAGTLTAPPPERITEAPAAGRGELADECRYDPSLPPMADYTALIEPDDPYLGAPDAAVTVLEFFDPNCPHCRSLHPIMQQVIQANRERARFYLLPFVVFPHSVLQTEALFVAAEEGKYFEMIDAQFALQKQGGLSPEELRQVAASLGLDPDRFMARVAAGGYADRMRSLRERLIAHGLRGVPAVMIDGRVVDRGSRSARCLTYLIETAAGGP